MVKFSLSPTSRPCCRNNLRRSGEKCSSTPARPASVLETRLHFVRGLVGECEGQDVAAGDAMPQQVRDAVRDDASFAAARAGQNEQGPFEMLDGLGDLAAVSADKVSLHKSVSPQLTIFSAAASLNYTREDVGRIARAA